MRKRRLSVERLEQRTLLSIFAAATDTSTGQIVLGPQTAFIDQPYVDIEVFHNGQGLGPYGSEGFGLYPFNHVLLDTGANSVLIVSNAASELLANGLPIEGTFYEKGVAGEMETSVSAPCALEVSGTSPSYGITTFVLPQTDDQVRILVDPNTHFGGLPAQWGGIPGLVGMPAMVGRVTTLDMSGWFNATDLLEMPPLGVSFFDVVPPDNGHRYSVAVDTRIQFDPHDGLPPGSGPDAPLPVWAPVPFVTAIAEHQGQRQIGNFLVDTGAQISMISTQTAFAIGLDENGNGSLLDEAIYTLPISGVGGTINAPVLLVDAVRLPTEQGVDLVWTNPDPNAELPGLELLVLDIAEGIDGIIGADLLTSGLDYTVDPSDPFFFEVSGNPYFERIHLDFRNLEAGSGKIYFDLNPDLDQIEPLPPETEAGVIIAETDGTTEVAEGGQPDSYTVVLASQPTADVTVSIQTDGQVEAEPATLVFTPDNWDVPQQVSVWGIYDGVDEGQHTGRITHTVTSADSNYDGLSVRDVLVTVNDPPQIVPSLELLETDGITRVVEGETSDTYSIRLSAPPTEPVRILVFGDAQLQVTPTVINIDADNWNQLHQVTVRALDDDIAQGARTVYITHRVSTDDPQYSGLTIPDVTVHIIDNDPQPLGTIDFLQLDHLQPANGDLLYSFETANDGFLTVQTIEAGHHWLEITLYDSAGNVVGQNSGSGPILRVDTVASAGDSFVVRIAGEGTDTTLRIANLVRQEGDTVYVSGTTESDRFGFSATGSIRVSANGVDYDFAAGVTHAVFDGGNGADQIRLIGGPGDDAATLEFGSAVMAGQHYDVTVSQVEQIHADGGPGQDSVKLLGSTGDDLLEAGPGIADADQFDAVLTSGSYRNTVKNFAQIDVIAEVGDDEARLFGGGSGSSRLDVTPVWSIFSLAGQYRLRLFQVEQLQATGGSTGLDYARVWTGSTNDRCTVKGTQVVVYPGQSTDTAATLQRLTLDDFGFVAIRAEGGDDSAVLGDGGPGTQEVFINRAQTGLGVWFSAGQVVWLTGVEQFDVTGSDTVDKAYLIGHDGPETFTFYPVSLQVQQTPPVAMVESNSVSSGVTVRGFGRVFAYAGSGGDDVAIFYDSPGYDRYWAGKNWATMAGDGFYVRAAGFDRYEAYGGSAGQGDLAVLYDSPTSNDRLEINSEFARIAYAGSTQNYVHAQGFRWVRSFSTGGFDTATIELPVAADQTVSAVLGLQSQVTVKGDNFWANVKQYSRVEVRGNENSGDNDTARIWDSPLDDQLFADGALDPDLLVASNALFELRLVDFAHIRADSSQGGDDTKDINNPELLDYVLETTGNWREI